jgi:hypothetical protein
MHQQGKCNSLEWDWVLPMHTVKDNFEEPTKFSEQMQKSLAFSPFLPQFYDFLDSIYPVLSTYKLLEHKIVTLLLTREEILCLTGYKMPARQLKWLEAQGFVYRVGADGHPRVDRTHYERMMGSVRQRTSNVTVPNFSSLRKDGIQVL